MLDDDSLEEHVSAPSTVALRKKARSGAYLQFDSSTLKFK